MRTTRYADLALRAIEVLGLTYLGFLFFLLTHGVFSSLILHPRWPGGDFWWTVLGWWGLGSLGWLVLRSPQSPYPPLLTAGLIVGALWVLAWLYLTRNAPFVELHLISISPFLILGERLYSSWRSRRIIQ
jgi:hypothetical protein